MLARILPFSWLAIMSDWVEKPAWRLRSTLFEDCSRALLPVISLLLSPLLVMSIDWWQHVDVTDLERLRTFDSLAIIALVFARILLKKLVTDGWLFADSPTRAVELLLA